MAAASTVPGRGPWARAAFVFALVAMAFGFRPAPARAAASFELDWHVYNHPHSCLAPGLVQEGQANFDVNHLPIPTYSKWGTLIQYNYDSWAMAFGAPFSGALLRIGTNEIEFRIATANDGDHCTQTDETVHLTSAGTPPKLLFQVHRHGTAFEGVTDVALSLREIDPALADSLAALKQSIADRRAEIEARAADLDAAERELERLAELEALIDELLERGFDGLTPEELDSLLSQYDDMFPGVRDALVEFLSDLQANIEELREEIARIAEVFRDRVTDVEGLLGGTPGFDPSNPDGFEPIPGGEVPDIDVPDILGNGSWSDDHDPYDDYASEVLAQLAPTISDGVVADRMGFLTIYEAWRYNTEALERALVNRTAVTVAEWGAFLRAKGRVLQFVEHYADERGWLKDAPIPNHIKDFLDFVLVLDMHERAKALKLELNQWTGQLTSSQRVILDVILMIEAALAEIRSRPPQSDDSSIWSTLADLADGAISGARKVGGVIVDFSPVGTFRDACEVVMGRQNCNPFGRELTWQERLYSAAGVVVGSGAVWKAAANGVSGAAAGVMRVAGDQADKWISFKRTASRARKPGDQGIHLSEGSLSKLALDPDTKKYAVGPLEEVRTALGAQEAGMIGKVTRAPPGMGADFIAGGRPIDVKAPRRGWLTGNSDAAKKQAGKLLADPQLDFLFDVRNISPADLAAELGELTSRGIDPQRLRVVGVEHMKPIIVGDLVF